MAYNFSCQNQTLKTFYPNGKQFPYIDSIIDGPYTASGITLTGDESQGPINYPYDYQPPFSGYQNCTPCKK